MEYDFSKINDEEYEELFKHILKIETGANFRTFAKGRDGGIDVISTNTQEKIIGQAKHYMKTSITIFGFNFEHYVDNILPNIKLAINRCYENELDIDMIFSEFEDADFYEEGREEHKSDAELVREMFEKSKRAI